MRDIIVTTPKSEMKIAAKEAEECIRLIQDGEQPYYFRTFHKKPKAMGIGSRVFYVEDGYIRGFATIAEIGKGDMLCEITDRNWGGECHIIMLAKNWKWIKPIPMKGFQGYRYFEPPKDMKIIGNYLDPKPND